METKTLIYQKLEDFIKKFYTNELLKGLIFFVGLGLLYFLFTLLVEYFLWLNPIGRTLLFWTFIAVEVFLLCRFIVFPLFKLFKLQKGIDYNQASEIIGNHFSEVSDKLTNFLQLSSHPVQSELLLASIDQKATSLQPVPFGNAINFKRNIKYLPWAIVPLLLVAFFVISGNTNMLSESMNRVVRYNEKFTPPAPFSFKVLNNQLQAEQGSDFILKIKTEGKIVPENAMIAIGDERYFMESSKPGEFEYRFSNLKNNVSFHVEANTVVSQDFQLQIIEVPSIVNFEMLLQFPGYLNRKSETVKGSGNAVVPEGTRVTWKVNSNATSLVEWFDFQKMSPFIFANNEYQFNRTIVQNTEYQILTSNKNSKHHEKLNYQIATIKDQYPSITVAKAPDSLKSGKDVLIGQVSDDYGLTKLQIVYYPKDKPQAAKKAALKINNDVFDQFIFTFPSNLNLEEGVSYDYYFEIFDNDAIHNFKSSKSLVFSDRLATQDEQKDQLLQQQNDNIKGLSKSIKNQDKQLSELDQLKKLGKENKELNFKDQQKINDFIKRQKQQEQMMKEFSKKLEDNLKDFKSENDPNKEQLEKRMENAQKEADENQKLLEELQKLSEKLEEEQLFDKMDKFKQSSKNQMKNLEQLVELTKRYYVEKKAEQLASKLDKLAAKQEKLSNDDNQNKEANQNELNKEFDKIQEELRQLDKDNKELKSPMDIPSDENQEKSIKDDMKKAAEELQKEKKENAKPKQKKAAEKMKQMSQSMMSGMSGGQMEQLEEDVKMMRQILDNLLAFSFSQEDLMKQFKGLKKGAPSYNFNLKKQQDLKQQFKHVDDSLFAMSLRNPMITERITEEIGNVHYNVDKSLENLAEAIISRGVSHQQYTISAANRLADFLSDVLNSMQMQMQSSGSGKGMPKPGQGGSGQLPDIIQKQQGLGEKVKEGMEKGDKSGDGKEGEKGEKKGEKPGSEGKGGQGSGDGEENAKELMEIYKEQRRLREQLQDALQKRGLTPEGQRVIDQMKDAEKQLLNKGFKNEVLQRMLNIKYEMLKLEKALQEQNEDDKRESQTNKNTFNSGSKPISPELQEYLNSVEILNRQTLPLRPGFNQKVQDYFKKND